MSFSKRKHHEEAEEGWLMSYADMITLLLAFFIILLSLMTMNKSSSEAVEEQMKEAFSGQVTEERPFTTLMEKIVTLIEERQLDSEMAVEENYKGLVLELASGAFYEPGSAEFRKEAIPVLQELSQMLKEFDQEDYLVEVEGHSDDVPIHTAQYPSNWELSACRATRVVRFFIEDGHEKEKMRAAGFADVEPKVPNLDEFGNPIPENRELNRRIVIRIERRD